MRNQRSEPAMTHAIACQTASTSAQGDVHAPTTVELRPVQAEGYERHQHQEDL